MKPFAGALSLVLIILCRTQTPSQPTFSQLFEQYRTGDADAAVRAFALWTPARAEAEAHLAGGTDVWARAALAMFHTEAGLANDTLGEYRPEVRILHGDPMDVEIHARIAVAEVRDLLQVARRTDDAQLRAFCVNWFATMPTTRGKSGDSTHDDAPLELIAGRTGEYWMGPTICCEFISFDQHADVSTSHGSFSTAMADAARRAFRRALELDPDAGEAFLRLGRVDYLLDRREDAKQEWTQATGIAARTHDVFTAYLARLFVGRLDEDEGLRDEAAGAYSGAIDAFPAGQTAYLALARLQIESGDAVGGWSTARRALSGDRPSVGRVTDPWYAYSHEQVSWDRAARLRALRNMVRR